MFLFHVHFMGYGSFYIGFLLYTWREISCKCQTVSDFAILKYMNYLLFILGAILAFLFWKTFAGKYEGDRPERSCRLLVGNYYLHLHHWLWSLILLIVILILQVEYYILHGLLAGSVIQGLTYRDWYYVIYHKDVYEKLYARFRK